MFYVVSYDIPDDKRRFQIARTLLDFGTRVQYSVFECLLDEKRWEEMVRRLNGLVDQTEDRLRIYPLCANCNKAVALLGDGKLTEDPEVYIV